MGSVRIDPAVLVEAFGRHPLQRLELDPESDAGLFGWLLCASLLSGRVAPEIALAVWGRLHTLGATRPGILAASAPETLVPSLVAEGFGQPEASAARLVRLAQGLEKAGGSLTALSRESESLEELGSRLSRLAPGFGTAAISTFLRPLRDLWWAAAELPLHPAARAAAVHLDYISDADDADGEPGALRYFVRQTPKDGPSFADIEWALERLGRVSCQAARPNRCPFEDACPLR